MKILLSLLVLTLVACSQTRDERSGGFHFPYKLNMHQGNRVSVNAIAALQIGMYKQQVEEMIGSPLIIDTFDENHWIYVQIDKLRGNAVTQKRISLFFADEKLMRVEQ